MAYNSATDKDLVQYDVLTLKLDSSTNPKLVYKKSTATNKGLNPNFFSGNGTKLVNILNKFANDMKNTSDIVNKVYDTYNPVVLNTTTDEGKALLEKMRLATGKDTLVESVTALANGEIGGLAFLNPDDSNDGFSIVYDADSQQFVLRESAPVIDQNLVLFEDEASKNDYLKHSICKVGQIGYYNNEHFKVVADSNTRKSVANPVKFKVIEKSQAVVTTIDPGLTTDNLSIADKDNCYVIEISGIKKDTTYNVAFPEPVDCEIIEYIPGQNTAGATRSSVITSGITISDEDTKKIYINVYKTDGIDNGFIRVGTGDFIDEVVKKWAPIHDYIRKDPVVRPIGGLDDTYVPSGSMEKLLDDILYPKNIAPTILDFKINDIHNRVHMRGYNDDVITNSSDPNKILLFNITYEKESNDLEAINIYKDSGTPFMTVNKADIPSDDAINLQYLSSDVIDRTTTFTVEIVDSTGLKSTKDLTIEFKYPIFYGILNGNYTDADIENMNKTIDYTDTHFEKLFTTTDYEETAIAFPKELATSFELRDQNGFLINDSYNKLPVEMTFIDANSSSYKVDYILLYSKDRAQVKNFKISLDFIK